VHFYYKLNLLEVRSGNYFFVDLLYLVYQLEIMQVRGFSLEFARNTADTS
jgi:hypothetical protein